MIKVRKEIKEIALDKLKEYSKNNKIHTEEQISLLVQIIDKFGFTTPLLIDKEYNIIAGHGRKKAAETLGMKEVPCILIDDLTENEIKELRIADNRVAELAETSLFNIKEEWDLLKDTNTGLEFLTGYGEDDFDFLTEEESKEVTEDDFEAPDDIEEVKTNIKRGDIIKLGNHRLMCGSSTEVEDVRLLTENNKVDMVFTDPPYGVSYTNNMNNKHEVIKNDDKILDFKPCLIEFSKPNIHWYIWTSDPVYPIWRDLYKDFFKSTVVWFKGGGGIGDLKGDYARNYELCLFCQYGRKELIGSRDGAVWEIGKDAGANYIHPTQKPVSLAGYALEKSSKQNESVLDLFGGSGSTLIACEQLNRKCYMMELDEKYCEVICQRWEKLTGKTREVLNG